MGRPLGVPAWLPAGPLCLLLAGAAWAPTPSLRDPKFESKAAILASRGSEELLCFTERLEDLVCFWEEAVGSNYSFTYQLEQHRIGLDAPSWAGLEQSLSIPGLRQQYIGLGAPWGEPRKPCELRQAPTPRGRVRFWCSLPTADTSSFVPLELRVTATASGALRYHRVIHINEVVLLDAPAGLLARRAEEGGHVVLRWLPPPGAPMTTHIRYEVDVSAGAGAGVAQRVDILEGRTECVLSNLRGGTRYTFAVRARMAEPSFSGFWSAWSEPASLLTASDLDPLILTLALILVLIAMLLVVLALLSNRRSLKQKIWPGIPGPESEFEGLFTTHEGNFQLWLSQRDGCLWWSPCSPLPEDPPAGLEVLSERCWGRDAEGPLAQPGIQEAKDTYLVLDARLRPRSPRREDGAPAGAEDAGSAASSCSSDLALKPGPEGTSPSSFEYTVLDPSSQLLRPPARPPGLPPTPPHLKYLYLLVSDSGISTDYSSGGSQGVRGDSLEDPYSHPYENSLCQPHTSAPQLHGPC